MLKVDIGKERAAFSLAVDTSFPKGVTALVGASGAGKSSLLRMISGLDRPDRGVISLDDRVWVDAEKRKFLSVAGRRIGMVFQQPRLVDHLSVTANVALGLRKGGDVESAIEICGVKDIVNRKTRSLSGGEQQRVMLARALAGAPELLMLDEPFSGLDELGRGALIARLQSVFSNIDIPVIFVSHAFEEAALLAKNFVHLRSGQVVNAGTAAEVLGGLLPQHDFETSDLSPQALEKATSSLIEAEVGERKTIGLVHVMIGSQSIDVSSAPFEKGAKVFVRLWARDVVLSLQPVRALSARNRLVGKIEKLDPLANGHVEVCVNIEGQMLVALVTSHSAQEMGLAPGKPVFAIFKTTSLQIVSAAGGAQ